MSARPGPGGGYHAEWYPYRDQELRSGRSDPSVIGDRRQCALRESRNRFHESEMALFSCKGQAGVFSTNWKPYRCQGVPEDSFRTTRARPA